MRQGRALRARKPPPAKYQGPHMCRGCFARVTPGRDFCLEHSPYAQELVKHEKKLRRRERDKARRREQARERYRKKREAQDNGLGEGPGAAKIKG